MPVFILDPQGEGEWAPGGASRWWLHQSLSSLDVELRKLGSQLVIRSGDPLVELRDLLRESGARLVCWNRRYEPELIRRDSAIKEALVNYGCEVTSCNSALLNEPWSVRNKSGKPYRVFTPYWRHCVALNVDNPLPRPQKLVLPKRFPRSLSIGQLKLEPEIDWAGSMRARWNPGESGAGKALSQFVKNAFADYGNGRDIPGTNGTSRLSPHLHFGELGPRQIWHALRRTAEKAGRSESTWRSSQFLAEVGWREFAHHLLYHFPHTVDQPLREEFSRFRWRTNPDGLSAWQRGMTGYPIVDAGMRELWATGWMHNRVRMIVASFLVKDLLVDWREGARWFWDTLVDADLASNTLGWQWTAGCGADAAPFFRIFNPTNQGEKFDADGRYVRRWVPELKELPDRWVHQPWNAPAETLRRAGVELGADYPERIVNHSIAREVALEAYGRLKGRE